MKIKSHERAPGQTQITLSLAKSLKAAISELARRDNRSRSNWIVFELKKIVEERLREKRIVPMAAEEPGEYKTKRGIKPHSKNHSK